MKERKTGLKSIPDLLAFIYRVFIDLLHWLVIITDMHEYVKSYLINVKLDFNANESYTCSKRNHSLKLHQNFDRKLVRSTVNSYLTKISTDNFDCKNNLVFWKGTTIAAYKCLMIKKSIHTHNINLTFIYE